MHILIKRIRRIILGLTESNLEKFRALGSVFGDPGGIWPYRKKRGGGGVNSHLPLTKKSAKGRGKPPKPDHSLSPLHLLHFSPFFFLSLQTHQNPHWFQASKASFLHQISSMASSSRSSFSKNMGLRRNLRGYAIRNPFDASNLHPDFSSHSMAKRALNEVKNLPYTYIC